MEELLALLGLLLLMFLVLAASVEVVMEVFRGVLESFGVTWAKSKISLDDALSLASEFAPDDKDLNTKLQAVRSVAQQLEKKSAEKIRVLAELESRLSDTIPEDQVAKIAGKINAVASEVKAELQKSERLKIFMLRGLAAVLGCVLVYLSNFYVFQIITENPNAQSYLKPLEGLRETWVNVLVGGMAAAAGSSYWHDKLDKVRKLKTVVGETQKFVK